MAQGAFTVLSLSMSGLAPGEVMIMGSATANGMLDYNFMLDLGIEKANTPPTITIDTNLQGQEAEWELDGLKFTLNGNVIDPDGQDVSMVLSICNGQTSNFNRDNLAWEIQVSIANCIQNNVESPYNVVIVATDESGASTTLSIDVVDPNAGGTDSGGDSSTTDGEEEGGNILPAPGLIATMMIGLVAAGWVSSRRD